MNKKEQALLNFKKAHSHLQKVIQMTEKEQYCIDIMQQNLAVIGLLKAAHQHLMEGHLDSCFINAMSTADKGKKEDMVKEILKVTKIASK